jgi:alpha-glucosidase
MFMEFPGQSNLALNDREFMFGEDLLIAAKVWDFVGKYSVSLPAGDWYDFGTGAKIGGGREIELNPALDTLPIFVKSGSIIPEQPVVQNADDTPRGPLTLEVYPGPQCHGTFYSDDGNTLAYRNGETLRVEFTCNADTDHVEVDVAAAQGPFQPWFHEVQFQIHGVGRNVAKVVADSYDVTGWKLQSGVLILPPLSWGKTGLHVSAQFSSK